MQIIWKREKKNIKCISNADEHEMNILSREVDHLNYSYKNFYYNPKTTYVCGSYEYL